VIALTGIYCGYIVNMTLPECKRMNLCSNLTIDVTMSNGVTTRDRQPGSHHQVNSGGVTCTKKMMVKVSLKVKQLQKNKDVPSS
jgi:hypothetical protein